METSPYVSITVLSVPGKEGSNADYVVIPEQNAIPFDPSISYEQGAMFEPSTVALHGLLQNDYQGGRRGSNFRMWNNWHIHNAVGKDLWFQEGCRI